MGRDPREHLTKIGQNPTEASRVEADIRGTETFWALRDVSFDVQPGEVVGIIGNNGAGKSTLLKILSRITEPTSGEIILNGRVGSLLEVGTGFHPELTGRENIYMNGTILGMSRKYIDEKFDEIVDFSGIEQFIDTPVKRYSSGMYVRLAFAVAAHLEPEILIIDEVLAVGDTEFQRKCLGKMGKIAIDGRTVLFVSHNMDAIKSLTKLTVLLSDGKLVRHDKSVDVVNEYIQRAIISIRDKNHVQILERDKNTRIEKELQFVKFEMLDKESNINYIFQEFEDITIKTWIVIHKECSSFEVVYKIRNINGIIVSTLTSGEIEVTKQEDTMVVICTLQNINLSRGEYIVSARLLTNGIVLQDFVQSAMLFEIIINDSCKYNSRELKYTTGCIVRLNQKWNVCGGNRDSFDVG